MIPRLYIRDVNDKAIATLDEGDYFDDNLTRYLAGKASVFEFSIYKNDGDYELFKAGKKVSFRYEDEDFWLSIMMTEQNETTLTITAVSLSLELNNEIAGVYSAPEAMSFADYLDAMINMDYTLEIGINEVSDKSIKNEWTGTSTLLARLFSLATVFDSELEFVTQLADNGGLDKIILNVYRAHSDKNQGLGRDRTNETFRFGTEITTVQKTEDISDVFTAIRPHGTDGLTIKDVEHEVLDDNGNILYATYKEPRRGFMDPSTLYAPQSRDLFPSTITGTTDKWIRKDTDELQYTSAEALYGYALGQLKQYSVPQTKWEISGYITARIGDTIRVADDGYKPEIYLNARITEQSISFTDPSKNKSTFSNVEELQSQISDDLLKVVEDLKKEINYVLSTTVDYQVSDQGTTVPTGDWLTDLPTTQPGDWLWTRTTQMMSNGTSVVGYTKAYNGTDGDDGISPEITVNPDTSLTITDKNGAQTTPKLQGPKGDQGIMGVAYAQPTAPTTKQAGATWFKTKSATDNSVIGIYTLIGTTWTETPVTADALAVTSLSALSANLGKVTAGELDGVKIVGAEFSNPYSFTDVDQNQFDGTLTIKDSTITNVGTINKGSTTDAHNYKTVDSPISKVAQLFKGADQTTLEQSYELTPSGLALNNKAAGFSGMLTAEQLTKVPWKDVPLLDGFAVSERNTPQYRKVPQLDGTYVLELQGQVKPTSGTFIGTGKTAGQLPEGYRPTIHKIAPIADDTCKGARLTYTTDGRLQINAPFLSAYVSFAGVRISLA